MKTRARAQKRAATDGMDRLAKYRTFTLPSIDEELASMSGFLLHRIHKPHLIACDHTIDRLSALAQAQPNFEGVTKLVRDAAQLSLATQTPMRVTPLLLLGPPGVGKTRYARALAAALDTTLESIDGATIPDMGSIVGYPPVWRRRTWICREGAGSCAYERTSHTV